METKTRFEIMDKVFIHQTNIITPLGFSVQENFDALLRETTGISLTKLPEPIGTIPAGKIDDRLFRDFFSELNLNFSGSRIEQLMIAALAPIVNKQSVTTDALLIISTTKGNVQALEQGNIKDAFLHQTAENIRKYFGFSKKPIVISNACVSGVMALSVAKRMIQMKAASKIFIVAADEITPFVVSGFQSFQAMSDEVCKPYDENRKGINLGEAAAAVFLSADSKPEGIEIAGEANINDANHISGPSRTGEGLYLSIQKAMEEAKITSDKIDFVSAHGTATLYNDEMESIAFQRSGLDQTPVNSFKGYYGHTLGAAGLLETIISMECMKQNTYLPSFGFEILGVSQPMNIIKKIKNQPMNTVLKTASGFGGSNSAMILRKQI